MVRHRPSEVSRGRADNGFSLVEILLAVSLLSIIVTVMYSAFHTMGRVIRRTEQTKDTYQTARLIMARMRQDLGCSYSSPKPNNFVFRGENVEGGGGHADELTFVTAGHIPSRRDAPEGDLAEISYYLDENNPGVLVRREDFSPDKEDKLEVGGKLRILGRNVVTLNFMYLDGTQEAPRTAGDRTSELRESQEEENAWIEEWNPEEKTYLPRAVRVDLAVENEEGTIEDFSTTIVLAMGRTATSTAPPTGQQGFLQPAGAAPRPGAGPRGPTGMPPPGGDRGGRGDRGRPDRGRGFDRGREGREGAGRPPGGSRGPGTPTSPTIQRNVPNAGSGTRPPTPGGRR